MRSRIGGENQKDSTVGQGISIETQMQAGISKFLRTKSKPTGPGLGLLLCGWLVLAAMLCPAANAVPAPSHSGMPAKASSGTAAAPTYPSPQEVMQAYPNEPERMAALVILRDVIWASDPRLPAPNDVTEGARNAARQLLGNASDAWRQRQGDAYNQAIKQVQASEGQTNFTRAQTILIYHGGTGSDSDDQARTFHEQLFAKFLPPLLAGIKGEEADIQAGGLRAIFGLIGLSVLALTGLAMLIVPWWFAGRGDSLRFGRMATAADANDPQILPEHLQMVKVPRLEYPVQMESAEVIDEKTWSETHVHVSTSGGGSRMVGNQIIHDPVSHHTSTTVVQKDRVWFRNLNNEQSVRTFSGGDFLTRQGQIISFLLLPLSGGDHRTLLAYNHATGSSKLYHGNLGFAHALKGLPLWGMMMGLAVAGGFGARMLLFHAINSPADARNVHTAFLVWLGLSAVLSLIYVGLIKLIYSGRRNRAFRRKYLPLYRQFFEQLTPQLLKRFGDITESKKPTT